MATGNRSGWSRLSASYRARLTGAGRSGALAGEPLTEAQTRQYWERGGDLRGGRAHRPTPTGAAPRQATERESVGLGDAATFSELERWRRRPASRGGPPAWLRFNEDLISTDTAAVLSQIDIPPSRWRKVQTEYLPSGQVILRVTPRRGYTRTVVLPDHDAASQVMTMLKTPGGAATSAAERRRMAEEWGRGGRRKGIEVEPPINSPGPKGKAA